MNSAPDRDPRLPPGIRITEFEVFDSELLSNMKWVAEEYLMLLWRYALTGKPCKMPWCCFLGNSGIGKTYLAQKMYLHCQHKIAPKRWTDGDYGGNRLWEASWLDFRVLMDRGRLDRTAIPATLLECKDIPILFVDDLGVGGEDDTFDKARVVDTAERLCSYRSGKPTVITCNMTLDELKLNLDPRIGSRMQRDGGGGFLAQGTTIDFNER